MPVFLYEGVYSQQTWAALAANPQDVSEVMKPSIERFGGRVVACFLSVSGFGGQPIGFIEFPDNKAATAWAIYLQASGVVSKVDLRPLLTTQEGVEVLRTVGPVGGGGW